MKEIRRSALVSTTPRVLFGLINDVERYPEFLPWCVAARLESSSESEVVASLTVKRGPLRTEFTTRNTLVPDHSIQMNFLRGPFDALEGCWTLTAVGDSGCRVELQLKFQFSNAVSAVVLEPVFAEMAASLVDAFVVRARTASRAEPES